MIDQLPDDGEMMVIVFSDKVEMIDQPHGRLETRMRDCSGKGLRTERRNAIKKLNAVGAEGEEDVFEWVSVMMGLVRPAILKICRGEFRGGVDEVHYTREPERFKINEVAGVLLR
jgi:hypothetical protein